MILSSSTRAASVLASLVALLLPSIARAQQPAVPATGEPPPPEARAQEQAAITNQAQQAYAATHQDELRQKAALQVAQERRFAWEQRGIENIPPAVITRPPALSLSLPGRFESGLGTGEIQLGVTADLNLRVRRWWGLGANVGILSLRSAERYTRPNSHLPAVITEASGYVVLASSKGRYAQASHGLVRIGHQLLFPIEQPALPRVYLGLFVGVGGVIAIGPIAGGKGWVGIDLEMRVGHRFGLGSGADSPVEGDFVDFVTGPRVGF